MFSVFLQKRLFFFGIVSVFILGGCFNFGGSANTSDTFKTYETNEFTVQVPKEWEIIEKKDFAQEVPQDGVVVFRNNVKNENHTAVVSIVRKNFQNPIPNLEFGNLIDNKNKVSLYEFKSLKKDTIKASISGKEEETFFLSFEGKEAADAAVLRYLQIPMGKGNNGFIITGTISLQENENTIKLIEEIVKSLKLK